MRTTLLGIAAFLCGLCPAQLTHTTSPQGVLAFSDRQPLARMAISGHAPGWAPFRQEEAAMQAAEGDALRGTIALPAPAKGTLSFEQRTTAEAETVTVGYALEFSDDSPLEAANVSVFLPTARFAGGMARLLPGEGRRELPVDEGDPQFSGSGAGFAVACGEGLEFAVIGSAVGPALVQDNRGWGGQEFEVRFALASGDVFAGQQAARSFTALIGKPEEIDALVKEKHPTMRIDRSRPLAVLSRSGEASVVVGDRRLMSVQVSIHGVGWAYITQGQANFSASGDSLTRLFTGRLPIPPDRTKAL